MTIRVANCPCIECKVDTLHVKGKCTVCGNIYLTPAMHREYAYERSKETRLRRTRAVGLRYGFKEASRVNIPLNMKVVEARKAENANRREFSKEGFIHTDPVSTTAVHSKGKGRSFR